MTAGKGVIIAHKLSAIRDADIIIIVPHLTLEFFACPLTEILRHNPLKYGIFLQARSLSFGKGSAQKT